MAEAALHKREAQQQQLPNAYWNDIPADNCWRFCYLGAMFQADGCQLTDIDRRIAMAAQRHGKMRHLWRSKSLHLKLRLRLYAASVCSVMTYGSEAWYLTTQVQKKINGAHSRMMSVITGKTPREEATRGTQTIDLLTRIRARRLQWLGKILRTTG